jgi:hypothetical protein
MSSDGVCADSIDGMTEMVKNTPRGSNQRLMSVAFDSTMIKDGIYVDINNDMTGIDITQPFDIIESKFEQMVSQC